MITENQLSSLLLFLILPELLQIYDQLKKEITIVLDAPFINYYDDKYTCS